MAYFKNGTLYEGEDSDEVTVVFVKDNLKYNLKRKQFQRFIKEMNFCVAPNGCIFNQTKIGVFPEFMTEGFAQRSKERQEIKKIQRENENLQKELVELEKLLSNM